MNFKPPANVANAARQGLLLHKKWERGGTAVGVRRAIQLMRRDPVSLDTIKRMNRFFIRHYKNRNNRPEDGLNGKIAWLLWGGNPGYSWVKKILKDY